MIRDGNCYYRNIFTYQYFISIAEFDKLQPSSRYQFE